MKSMLFSVVRTCILITLPFLSVAGNLATVSGNNSATAVQTFNGARVMPGKFVVKVHPAYRANCNQSGISDHRFVAAVSNLNATTVEKKFKREFMPVSPVNRFGRPSVDLSLVYQLHVDPSKEVSEVIAALMNTGILIYAEPLYSHDLDYNPNDPQAASQYALNKINAYNAWNITKGDTTVVVGIVDSGTDWDHPDLAANIAYNWNDPIDGQDNDNDGYVDNFRGWDVSENNNDPMVDGSDHGSHVSGCAAAVTDNNTGVASPGFNCRFLPVKSSLDPSVTSIDNGYDGVYYSATHGCSVINCSWGRGGGPSQFEQDVVDFATFTHDAVVVAAAGNNGSEQDHYPSSYKNVLSVASTSSTDAKSGFSNYCYAIDVCAPGSSILSTVYNDNYVAYSGTSMASPIAAGGVALVRSRFPGMNALQAAQQLRVTCDNIYGIGVNSGLRDKLGKGRINLFRAVNDTTAPGVVVDALSTYDGNDNVFIAGDTLQFTARFLNLLRPTNNLVCSLSSVSTNVTILQNTFNAGVVNSMDTISNYSAPYRVLINPGTPLNTEVAFRITMTDGTWSDAYAFKVVVNVDYINIEVNDVGTSITSKGLIGYNEAGQVQGIGFTYQGGPTILYEMGLMVGAAGTQVSDYVRGAGANYDSDFSPVLTVSGQQPGAVSSYDAYGKFSDNGSTSGSPLPVLITHRAFAWDSPNIDRKYIIVEYSIKNTGSSTLNDLYAGLFADWDIPNYANNKADEDLSRRMGYCWSTDAAGLYAGIKLLSNSPFNHYAIDNVSGGNGGMDLSDGYDDSEKYTSMSTQRAAAGNVAPTGNDVIDVVSTGGFNLAAGDSVTVAFALIAGENLASVQVSADAAQIRYDNNVLTGLTPVAIAGATRLNNVFPNPAASAATLEFEIDRTAQTTISVFTIQGDRVMQLIDENLSAGRYTLNADVTALPAGSYIIRFESGDVSQLKPLQVIR